MTKETSTPESQEAQTTDIPANVTVFSDGSTFDYENGYQSNGAPAATRERADIPAIVKSHKLFTLSRLLGVFVSLVAVGALLSVGVISMFLIQQINNIEALKAGINSSGQAMVVEDTGDGILVKRPDGGIFKCGISLVSNDGHPLGLVFCAPGGPATFSIPLPHDPNNIFYTAPTTEH
jgi:hypothetical protein